MKIALGIIVILVLALGVWLSLSLEMVPPSGAPAPIVEVLVGQVAYETPQLSIQYPQGYTLDSAYTYTGAGPERTISGAKFTVDPAIASGTNLSLDSYVSVEPLSGAINSCSAEIYLSDAHSAGFVDEGGHRYSIATSSGAAAGNRYEETVFATPVDGGCVAVRYFIHYGVLENYPEDTVQAFDRQALLNQFDSIRKTLVLR